MWAETKGRPLNFSSAHWAAACVANTERAVRNIAPTSLVEPPRYGRRVSPYIIRLSRDPMAAVQVSHSSAASLLKSGYVTDL